MVVYVQRTASGPDVIGVQWRRVAISKGYNTMFHAPAYQATARTADERRPRPAAMHVVNVRGNAALRPSRIAVPPRQCACGAPAGTLGECAMCRDDRAASHAEAGFLYQGRNGETGCDVSVGTPSTTIFSPSPCVQDCVKRHEAVHAADIGPCCKKANKAHGAAKTETDKTDIQDKFNQWVVVNTDWLECRAYAESARCGKELSEQKCAVEQSVNSSDPVQSDEDTTPITSLVTGQSKDSEEAASDPGALTLNEVSAAVPQDGGVTDDTIPCCATLRNYARVSAGRRDTVCASAKKSLGACPFP